ncbi:MAG: hypothetical protein ABI866_03040 [Dokdonella sp.]
MIIGIPPYLLLLIALYLIYALDCLVLLYANEAIVKSQETGWRVDFGSRQTWVAGKRVYLLNPFTPLTAIYRTHWKIAERLPLADKSALEKWAAHSRLVSSLDARIAATAWVVLVVLPIAMLLWGPLGFLVGAAFSWLVVIVLLVRFAACRRALDLSNGDFALLAFECLACPPCAVNLLRKLSLRYRTDVDLVALAAALDTTQAASVLDRVGQQADARLIMMDNDTPEYEKTCAYREVIRFEHSRLTSEEAGQE